MFARQISVILLLIVSVTVGFPVVEISDSGSGALNKTSVQKCNTTSSGDSLEPDCMEEGGDRKEFTDSNTDPDPGQPAAKNESCFMSKNFTETFTEYKEGENGEPIPFNVTITHTVSTCCDGYTGTTCEIDLCKNLTCSEDPNSRCTIVKRCGVRFPIFVTNKKQARLSDKCVQPEASRAHLCADDTCSIADSVCPDYSNEAELTVCLGNGCGCSAGPTWYLQQNGREIDCYKNIIS